MDRSEEDIEEVYGSVLSAENASGGYQPYTDKIHLNYFYQRILNKHDIRVAKDGSVALPAARLSILRKSKPMTGD